MLRCREFLGIRGQARGWENGVSTHLTAAVTCSSNPYSKASSLQALFVQAHSSHKANITGGLFPCTSQAPTYFAISSHSQRQLEAQAVRPKP